MVKDNKLQIIKAEDSISRNAFISLPYSLYREDPLWIPPLLLERRMHLSLKNPYFEHAKCCFWIALRGKIPVGRISAQIDRLYLERYKDSTGFWGMLESEDRKETFKALLETAEIWLRDQGMIRALGPFNLSINQESGLLVDGFNTPPSIMMGHAFPYYARHIEECGYEKAMDMLAYTIERDEKYPPVIRQLIARNAGQMRTRSIRKACLSKEMDTIFSIFNDAWSKNWGFIPFTRQEYQDIGKDFRFLAKKELVRIAEIDGRPVAFIAVIPNLNEVIRDLNGRLLPFGWLKILWRLKIRYPKSARVVLMGVVREYQDSLAGAALVYGLISDVQKAVYRLGIESLELSWILETNKAMRNIIEAIGGKVYKTYRIYGKKLKTN